MKDITFQIENYLFGENPEKKLLFFGHVVYLREENDEENQKAKNYLMGWFHFLKKEISLQYPKSKLEDFSWSFIPGNPGVGMEASVGLRVAINTREPS